MTTVLHASALLAFVQGEEGTDLVEEALAAGASCGAANWSEVAQKLIAAERDWDLVRALLTSYDLHVEPVTADDAESAARRWRDGDGLSLTDRVCMAVGARLDAEVLTADASWGVGGSVRQIR